MKRADSVRDASLIADAIASAEVEDRRQATSLLGALGVDKATPLLLIALGDEDWRVRKEATGAARSFVSERAFLLELVRMLGPGDNVGLRNAVVDVLAQAGNAATPLLGVALASLDPDGKKLAVEALGRSQDPGALEPLETALRDADANVRQGAVEAIATLGPFAGERVTGLLIAALDDADPVIRLAALEGLTALGVAIPWAKLAPLLDDPAIRPAALDAAAHAEAPEAATAVVRVLTDARGAAFEHALDAVAELAEGPLGRHVGEALNAAGDALGDRLVDLARANSGAPVARRATALALASRARARGMLEAAVAALDEELLADGALAALRALGPGSLPALVAHVANPVIAPAVRAEIVDTIAAMAAEQDPARVPWPSLLGAIRAAAQAHDGDKRLVHSALAALARIGTLDDLDVLAGAALSTDRTIAHAALGALDRLATRFPTASRAFVDRLRADPTWTLPVATVVGALSPGATDPGDMAYLAHAATAGEPAERSAAVAAVAQIGGPAAMEVLSFALADEEHDVQLAAARGLGHLCAAQTRQSPRDTIPDTPVSSRRAGEILQLIERSGAPDLVSAAVRAIGDGLAAMGGLPDEDLIFALASFARHATSSVALASVDALAQAPDGDVSARALAAGLEHADDDVVRSALLKLASRTHGWEAATQALSHASPAVRLLAIEALAGRDEPHIRAELQRRAAAEPNADVKAALGRSLVPPARREGR